MKIKCGSCGEDLDLTEEFFTGGAAEFWEKHGHYPEIVIYMCVCGDTRLAGPAVTGFAVEAIKKDATNAELWYQEHRAHNGPIAQQERAQHS